MSWDVENEIGAIREGGLFRELRTLGSGQGASVMRGGATLANFSSNDYLGLAASDELKAALKEGVERFGAGSGASRLVCGSLAPHEELERQRGDVNATHPVHGSRSPGSIRRGAACRAAR